MIRTLPSIALLVGLIGWGISTGIGATYPLQNGTALSGDVISANAQGLIVKRSDGTLADRVAWTNFSQTALKELANLPQAKGFVEALIEEDPQEIEARKRAVEIKVSIPERPPRADPNAGWGALFSSGLSVTMLLLVYLANLYAAFEISIFRNRPPALVILISAVAPIVGPILFLSLPTYIPSEEGELADELMTDAPNEASPAGGLEHARGVGHDAHAAAPVSEHAHGAPPGKHPPPTIFPRGQFTFNRRFFETRLAGFLRVVPGEAERDMVLHIRSGKGEHAGNRILRVTPNEIYLQVTKGAASHEVIIPFVEISEIQIRHKDI